MFASRCKRKLRRQGGALAVQVRHVVACQLVTPRRIVAGSLRITTLQLEFTGEPEEGSSDLPRQKVCD